jgi:hypothetical protein
VEWAPIGSGFSGPVVRLGQGCPAGSINGSNPDDPYFNGNSPTGRVALIDRGACAISLKVDRATKAGAVAVIIANNVGGDPPTFSFGGGDQPLAPTIVISQADGNRIKSALGATGLNAAVVASVSPATTIPLVGSMVASSSRGPSHSGDAIKPDVGAPGASISAIAGSGNETEAFGGTSGAAPMVAGSAALLLSIDPAMTPIELKARLVVTGETNILTNPATRPGELAPITRIGGGEVRADRAAAVSTIAFDHKSRQPNLSFGFVAAAEPTKVTRLVTIRNLSAEPRYYTLTPTFRYAADEASGAVAPSLSRNVAYVGPRGSTTVELCLTIDPARLPVWPFTFSAGSHGTGSLLNGPEFDGYLLISGEAEEIHVPWHVLPRASAAVSALQSQVTAGTSLNVSNWGAVPGEWSAFALTGTSPRIPKADQPGPGENLATIDLRAAGVRAFTADGFIQFAVNTWDERSHPAYPAGFEIQLDTNLDGNVDVFVYNAELTGFAATGQTVVVVQRPGGPQVIRFFLDADLNSSNRVFTAFMSDLGLTATSQFDFTVLAYDNYFSGVVTDVIGPMRYTPGTPRFLFGGDLGDGALLPGESAAVPVTANPGGSTASPSQSGILLMHYANPQGKEASQIRVRQ